MRRRYRPETLVRLVIPLAWWAEALPETRAAVRSASEACEGECCFRMPIQHTDALLRLLVTDYRESRRRTPKRGGA